MNQIETADFRPDATLSDEAVADALRGLHELRQRCAHFEEIAGRLGADVQIATARTTDLERRLREMTSKYERTLRACIEMQAQFGNIQMSITQAGESVRHAARMTGGGQIDAPPAETAEEQRGTEAIARKFAPRIGQVSSGDQS